MPDDEITDWLYNALKEIEAEEGMRLSDRAFVADHLAPKLLSLLGDVKRKERERIMNEIEEHEIPTVKDLHLIRISMCREDWQSLREGRGDDEITSHS